MGNKEHIKHADNEMPEYYFVENCINILHMFTLKTNVNYYIFAVTAIKRCFANCDIPNLLVPSCHVSTKLVFF